MAIKKSGDTTVRELQPAWDLDPVYGRRKILRLEGFEEDLLPTAEEYRAAGYHAEIEPIQGTWCRLRVLVPNPQEGTPAPVDTYERLTELVQDDIRNNPKVIAAAGDTGTLTLWYKDAKEKIKAGQPISYVDGAGGPDVKRQAFYELLARGADAFQERRIVLRRRRVISGNQVAQSSVNTVEKFYSTAALVQAFGIPALIGDRLPVAGDVTPSNTLWGWMERQDTSVITPAYNQVEEVKDWVFAAWSTLLYEYVT